MSKIPWSARSTRSEATGSSRPLASSPPSGIRTAQLRPPGILPDPADPGVADAFVLPRSSESFVPDDTVPDLDDPQARTGPWESDSGLTRVAGPDPELLAIARGEIERRRRGSLRFLSFFFGLALGAVAMWGATRDLRADAYAARQWVASSLRSMRGVTAAR